MSISRLKLAFLLAPMMPSIFFLVSLGMSERNTIVMTLLFTLSFSYLSCLIIGVPLVAILKKKQCLNVVNIVISGAIIGSFVFYLFGFVFVAFLDSSKGLIPIPTELLWGALIGVLVAYPFSLIAGFPFWARTD